MGSISQGMNQARGRTLEGRVGALYRASTTDETRTGLNQSPQAVQVVTVTLTDQGDDDDVVLTINDEDVEYNTGTGKTLATFGAEFADAVNENPIARGVCEASFDTATLTLTGLWPGQTFDVSIANDPDSVLSAVTTTQAADEADPIPFGRCVISQGFVDDSSDELVAIAKSSLMTAQVITIAFGAFVDAQVNTIYVYEVRGEERELIASVSEVAATSRDATIDALVALLNTDLPDNSVIAAADNATATAIVLTAEVAGLEFDVEVLAGHEGATLQSLDRTYTTGPNESTSIHRALRGVSRFSDSDPCATVGGDEGEYAGNAGVIYLKHGEIWVDSDGAVDRGDPVYIELGASNSGKLYTTDSATRLRLANRMARWIRDGNNSGDGIAALRVAM